jgi:hypothetical protein
MGKDFGMGAFVYAADEFSMRDLAVRDTYTSWEALIHSDFNRYRRK